VPYADVRVSYVAVCPCLLGVVYVVGESKLYIIHSLIHGDLVLFIKNISIKIKQRGIWRYVYCVFKVRLINMQIGHASDPTELCSIFLNWSSNS
jgi:hypothetical protein